MEPIDPDTDAYRNKVAREVDCKVRELITEMCGEIGHLIAEYVTHEESAAIPLSMFRLANRMLGTWEDFCTEEAKEA